MKRLLSFFLSLFCLSLTLPVFTACDSVTQQDVLSVLEDINSLLEEEDTTDESESTTEESEDAVEESDSITVAYGEYYYDVENVVLYLDTYGELPENYITKDEAEDLGWAGGSVEVYKDGAAIGGDYFGNYEKNLPSSNWIECDIDTEDENSRGAKRLVFSLEDGLYYYTDDHYETFVEVYITEDGDVEYR